MVLTMEIGTRLKEAREANNFSLDDVQQTTKIQKRYLQAIEKGNFDVMPGAFYVRAFIKEYAIAVGLDPDELIEEHNAELPATSDESSTDYTRVQRSKKDTSSTKRPAIFSLLPTIMIVLLVIGIIFAVWYFYTQAPQNNNEETNQSNENGSADEIFISDGDKDSSSEGSSNDDDQQEQDGQNQDKDGGGEQSKNEQGPEPELKVIEKGTGTTPESTLELINPDEEISIKFEAEDRSYLGVENGKGKTFFMRELNTANPTFTQDISGEETILLNIGDASVLDITINGIPLEYPVDPNEKVHQRITINIGKQAE